MRVGIKHVSIVAVTTAVLAAAACGGSGKTSGSGAALTTDQISSVLLTDKDQPDYQYSALSDTTTTVDYPAAFATGGSACQTFQDAEDLLSTKYGTTVDVFRTLDQKTDSGSDTLLDHVGVLPSSAKAATVVSDLAAGLKGCPSFTSGEGSSTTAVTVSANSPAPGPGHVAFTVYMTGGSHDAMDVTDMVQVGTAVARVTLLGGATHDTGAVQQMVATVSRLAEAQASRLKAAEG